MLRWLSIDLNLPNICYRPVLKTVVQGFQTSGTSPTDIDEQNNSALNSGAVYVFTRTGDQWSQQVYLKASNPGDISVSGLRRQTQYT